MGNFLNGINVGDCACTSKYILDSPRFGQSELYRTVHLPISTLTRHGYHHHVSDPTGVMSLNIHKYMGLFPYRSLLAPILRHVAPNHLHSLSHFFHPYFFSPAPHPVFSIFQPISYSHKPYHNGPFLPFPTHLFSHRHSTYLSLPFQQSFFSLFTPITIICQGILSGDPVTKNINFV